MKATKKLAAMLGGALLTTGLLAAPSVEITAVQQQYPWTNTVDITYEVQGVTNMEYFVRFTPTTSDDDPILNTEGEASIQVALESNGVFTAQWYPQTNLQYTACKMTPAIFRGGSGGGRDYLIIDLEDWSVTYEPMATQEASNQKYNTNEYKTKKLVLRKIPADTYTIGTKAPTNGDPNTPHEVEMKKDYYYGIFHLTEAQYNRMSGGAVSSSRYPAVSSYNTMRGAALPPATPSKGPLFTLSQKTGLKFDLPTQSMAYVAAAAGKTTTYVCGDTYTDLAKYAWCGNVSTKHEVGLLLPNDWGIFDACGNVWDCTRDNRDSRDLATIKPDGQTPITTGNSGIATVVLGGFGDSSWTMEFTSLSYRGSYNKSSSPTTQGFRVSMIVE